MVAPGTRLFLLSLAIASAVFASRCGPGGGGSTETSGRLATLHLEGLVLEPAFDPDVEEYTATPALCTSKVQLRLSAAASDVRIEVNQMSLPPGATEVEIPLEAETTFVRIRLFDPNGIQLASYEIVMGRAYGIAPSYLKASFPDRQDNFGRTVGISGNTVVVGAWNEDGDGSPESDDGLEDAGAAYVYVRSGDTWPQQAYLKPSLPELGALFGNAVAVSGDTIVVGACGRDFIPGPNDPKLKRAGAAFVFVREAGGWTQQARLLAPQPGADDYFGWSVAASGDTIVVGAHLEDSDGSSPANDSLDGAGAAYVYVRDGASWAQQAFLKSNVPAFGEQFGNSVAIAGDTLVVGGFDTAQVFTRSGGIWTHQATLQTGTSEPDTWFGQYVALWDDTVIVSALQEDSTAGGPTLESAGAVYVFERGLSGWDRTARLEAWNAESYDQFGSGVAVWEDVIVVGAGGEDSDGSSWADNTAHNAGAVYLFFRRGAGWVRGPYLKAGNADAGDEFGRVVAIDGGTVVAGADREQADGSDPLDNSLFGAGAAYGFR